MNCHGSISALTVQVLANSALCTVCQTLSHWCDHHCPSLSLPLLPNRKHHQAIFNPSSTPCPCFSQKLGELPLCGPSSPSSCRHLKLNACHVSWTDCLFLGTDLPQKSRRWGKEMGNHVDSAPWQTSEGAWVVYLGQCTLWQLMSPLTPALSALCISSSSGQEAFPQPFLMMMRTQW